MSIEDPTGDRRPEVFQIIDTPDRTLNEMKWPSVLTPAGSIMSISAPGG